MAGGSFGPAGVAKDRAELYQGKVTPYVIIACIVAAVGGSIFGYDIGISGGVTSMDGFLKQFFHTVYTKKQTAHESNYCKYNNQGLSAFTSSLYLAGLVATLVASTVTRKYGRRASIICGGTSFLAGAALNAASVNLEMLILGRIMLGVGIGFGNQAVPLYLSEMAPTHLRGALNMMFQLATTLGIFTANMVNYGTQKLEPWGWRLSLGLAAFPALLMTIGGVLLPETPNSLIERGSYEKGRQVLEKIRGTKNVNAEYQDMMDASEFANSIKHPFRNILQKRYRPQLVLAIFMPMFQILTGINSILFYAPVLFQSMGFGGSAALYSSALTGAVLASSTLISIATVDKFGRRFLLISGGIQMVICQVAVAILLGLKFGHNQELSKSFSILVVAVICLFVLAFGWSWGPLGWTVPSEIFPLETRSAGQSITVAVNLLFTFIPEKAPFQFLQAEATIVALCKTLTDPQAMAGRSSAATMIVTNTPAADLALTNLAFCSPSDLQNFAVPGSKLCLALVADSFVLSIAAHDNIRGGHIGLNAIQRRHARVSTGDSISVSRFVPPEVFNLALLTLELEFVKKGTKNEHVDAVLLANQLRKRFIDQVMTSGQRVSFEYHGNNYIFTVTQAVIEGQEKSNGLERGMISKDTYFIFEAPSASGIKIVNQREAASSNLFKHKEFNLQSLGIGGLSAEFADIFRRAFASRVFPPHVTNKLGIKHVKGMLLYGPPGTGKTLMARQIGKMLNGAREPKIINGPEVLSKFVGETEKNVRDLFADAENDQRTRGDESDLHVIIFDEIDAICKSRGSTRDGTGVHDSIVNQLLTKIDGVESLNNVLLIGMTNRKDMLDEALLRPGRLEVQIEISLPDENGRLQIIQIHTNKMKESSFLAPDVNLQELAARTKNYSGAELEGVVKSAVSYALNRQLSLDDLTKPVDEENIKVTMSDFLNALHEIVPAFGASTDDLERCRLNGMVECGERHKHIYQRAMLLVEQVKVSKGSPLVTCLLEGPSGSGKSALAATVGIDSDFPYVKIVSAETMIGLHESTKCAQIVKVFEDAYKSPLSIIILDGIERLLEYVAIGPRFSNLISQTLLVLLKRLPPKGKKLLVMGTTSEVGFLDSLGICDAFSVTYHVPTLKAADAKRVLEQLNVFADEDIDSAAEALNDMPIKKLYMLVEMAAQGEYGGSSEAIYAGKEKIKIAHFYDILQDVVRY